MSKLFAFFTFSALLVGEGALLYGALITPIPLWLAIAGTSIIITLAAITTYTFFVVMTS